MWQKRICLAVALALFSASASPAFAERGYIGVLRDDNLIVVKGVSLLKVTQVHPGSNFSGVIRPGDYIFEIDGQRFKSIEEYNALLNKYGHGDYVEIAFIRASENGAIYRPVAPLVGESQLSQIPASPQQAPSGLNKSSPNVDWNGVAAMGVIGLGLGLMLGPGSSGSANSGSGGGSSSYDPYAYQSGKQGNSNDGGASMKPDTSIGCAWGDTAYGTCH